jgi:hypothetical protein
MKEYRFNEYYGTLSETIHELIKLGYTVDFNLKDEAQGSQRSNIILFPHDYTIDKVYRFEGDADPDYQSILYAISSLKYKVKGTLVNGYGISSEEASSKLVEKINITTPCNTTDHKAKTEQKLPDVEQLINAPLVEKRLDENTPQINSESTLSVSDGKSITLFKSDTLSIVLIGLHTKAD